MIGSHSQSGSTLIDCTTGPTEGGDFKTFDIQLDEIDLSDALFFSLIIDGLGGCPAVTLFLLQMGPGTGLLKKKFLAGLVGKGKRMDFDFIRQLRV